MTGPPPSAPPGPEAALLPNPGPGEVPAAATALPPSLRSLLSRRFGRLQSQQWRPLVNAPRIPPQLNLLDCIHLSRTNLRTTLPAHRSIASGHRQKPPGIQVKGTLPFEHLEVDFTEMKPHRHYHYLLVIICTFSFSYPD